VELHVEGGLEFFTPLDDGEKKTELMIGNYNFS
jgi:hypothetical protein